MSNLGHHWPGHAEDVQDVEFGKWMMVIPFMILVLALMIVFPPLGLLVLLWILWRK